MLCKISLSKDIKRIQISYKVLKLFYSYYSIKIYTHNSSWEHKEGNTALFEIVGITAVRF
jgi:hypothetical protein